MGNRPFPDGLLTAARDPRGRLKGQQGRVVLRLRRLLGDLDERVIGVLGLSFKPDTDDMHEVLAAVTDRVDHYALFNSRSSLNRCQVWQPPLPRTTERGRSRTRRERYRIVKKTKKKT